MWASPEAYYLVDKADVSFYVFVLLAFAPVLPVAEELASTSAAG